MHHFDIVEESERRYFVVEGAKDDSKPVFIGRYGTEVDWGVVKCIHRLDMEQGRSEPAGCAADTADKRSLVSSKHSRPQRKDRCMLTLTRDFESARLVRSKRRIEGGRTS